MTWTFLCLCFPLLDTDFWWHLKTGEWILANGQVPYVDLYTFTDSKQPWIDLHWGFQVLVTLLYRLGGVPLVTLVKAATITTAVAIAWQAGGNDLPTWKKAAIWLMPIICITGRGNERPEMLSLLFLAMWLWVAVRTDRSPRWIWWLPVVTLVWVNCHALFILGLVTGFCYAVDAVVREWAAERLALPPRVGAPPLRIVWIVAALVAAVCFANPYFEEGALFPLTLYRKFSVEKDFYCRNIGEFRPPIQFLIHIGFGNIYLDSELGVFLITASSFVILWVRRRRWSLFRALMFAGFSHLAWQASRNTNIFSLVAGVITCENLSDALSVSTSSTNVPLSVKPSRIMSAIYAGLCLVVVTGVWNQIGEKNKPFGLGEAPHWFAHDAAKFASQPGFPERAFVSNLGQAEVYIFHNWPARRVFMDARLEVCTQKTFEKFNRILELMAHADPTWQQFFADGELPVVILDSRVENSRMAISGLLFTSTWRLVFADRAAAVFLPVPLANQLGLPMVDPTPLKYPDGPPRIKK